MTDENRFLSPALANWVAKFNSEAPCVLGLKKNYSLQMRESMAPAMDQASEIIAGSVRPYFQWVGPQLAEQTTEPYREAIRAVFPEVSVSQDAIGEMVRNLTVAVESGSFPEDVLEEVQQDSKGLLPRGGRPGRPMSYLDRRNGLAIVPCDPALSCCSGHPWAYR